MQNAVWLMHWMRTEGTYSGMRTHGPQSPLNGAVLLRIKDAFNMKPSIQPPLPNVQLLQLGRSNRIRLLIPIDSQLDRTTKGIDLGEPLLKLDLSNGLRSHRRRCRNAANLKPNQHHQQTRSNVHGKRTPCTHGLFRMINSLNAKLTIERNTIMYFCQE